MLIVCIVRQIFVIGTVTRVSEMMNASVLCARLSRCRVSWCGSLLI